MCGVAPVHQPDPRRVPHARGVAVTVESYRVELDLSRAADPDAATFPLAQHDRLHRARRGDLGRPDRRPGRRRPARTAASSTSPGTTAPGSPLPAWRPDATSWWSRPTCRYSRSGEGLHRFIDPVDGATYLYTHFEPTDARRVFANFEQPDLKAPVHVRGHRPARTGRSCPGSPSGPDGRRPRRPSRSPRRRRSRPTSPRSPPGPTTASTDVWERDGAPRSRSGCSAGRRWPSTSSRTRSSPSPGRAWTSTTAPSASPTPGASTTRSSSPSTTSARWRTPASSPSPRASSTAARPRGRTGPAGPR